MQAYDLAELLAARERLGRPYHEFLRVPALSTGIYALTAGSSDPQQPHTEDEIYYVISGRAQVRVAGEDRAVAAGSVVFVPARVAHQFHTIAEDLVLLVVFAPAQTRG